MKKVLALGLMVGVIFQTFLLKPAISEILPQSDIATIENLDQKVSLDFANANLKDVLKVFTKQTGVNFVIDNEISSLPISLFLEKVTVRQALRSIAETHNLGFYPIQERLF